MQELVDDIKWLREQYSHGGMLNLPEITTINRLVDLVGEMVYKLEDIRMWVNPANAVNECDQEVIARKIDEALTKSSPIAALARGRV